MDGLARSPADERETDERANGRTNEETTAATTTMTTFSRGVSRSHTHPLSPVRHCLRAMFTIQVVVPRPRCTEIARILLSNGTRTRNATTARFQWNRSDIRAVKSAATRIHHTPVTAAVARLRCVTPYRNVTRF